MSAAASAPEPTEVAVLAAQAADAKKAGSTLILDVGPLLGIVDTFVITSGTNDRQVRTIAEEVELRVKREFGRGPLRTEGLDDARWVLLDFGDVVVHVFNEETRRYYDLERLWSDARRVDWAPDVEREPDGVDRVAEARAALEA